MRRFIRDTTPIVAVLACMLSLFLGTAGGTVPSHQPMYWGAWFGDQSSGEEPPWDMSAVTRFERKVGKGLSLLEFSSPFAECEESAEPATCRFMSFPVEAMQKVREYGAIPFFSWNSAATPATVEDPEFQLSDILQHRYDRYIKAFATEAAAWGHPFFLRFDWEMNGSWFPWATGVNGNRPREFVQAWRHVHDIFRSAGATNATWVWCPYVEPEGKERNIARFYPGKRYVDWTCLDAYNFGRNAANPRPWRSFDTLVRPTYQFLTRRLAPGKPVVLGELASNDPARRKAGWIRQMFKSISTNYPAVRGLVWFERFDRDLRWPVETGRGPTRAFRLGLRASPFVTNQFSQLDASPIPPPR
ncbi:MAG: hypothetical protein JST08_00870 [Actinobacteria bacterium]|nr:hypothetical protein [Actinomycetota bacterium]